VQNNSLTALLLSSPRAETKNIFIIFLDFLENHWHSISCIVYLHACLILLQEKLPASAIELSSARASHNDLQK
jgi:hypothetical protein